MRSRAFLLEPAELDVTGAGKFGVVTRLFRHHTDHDHPSRVRFADQLIQRLTELEFSPDSDFIIITGQLVAMVATASAVVSEYGQFKGLIFDGRACEYKVTLFGGQKNACHR